MGKREGGLKIVRHGDKAVAMVMDRIAENC